MSNGQGPPSITDRLRSTADGAQAAADLIGAGAAGLAAAQAFRSQLPQNAADYVRLNVLPRPGPAQPPPQIIGRPSDVERFLDEAGQRAQEVECGAAQAVEETAAVAAEEGKVAVGAEGVGGAFGYLGGLAEGAAALAPTAGEVAGTLAGAAELARRQRRGWPWASQAAQPTASRVARAGCWRTRSSGPSRAARTRPCRTSGPPATWATPRSLSTSRCAQAAVLQAAPQSASSQSASAVQPSPEA